MSNEQKQFSHNPTVSITEAPVFPLNIFDEEDEMLFTDRVAKVIEGFKGTSVKGDEHKYKEPTPEPAIGFLDEAAQAMKARAALRDTPEGERTAGKIAKVFNAITGHTLTEEDAWLFLIVLKIVRSRSGKYSRDDYVDLSAYSALLGEHASTIPR